MCWYVAPLYPRSLLSQAAKVCWHSRHGWCVWCRLEGRLQFWLQSCTHVFPCIALHVWLFLFSGAHLLLP